MPSIRSHVLSFPQWTISLVWPSNAYLSVPIHFYIYTQYYIQQKVINYNDNRYNSPERRSSDQKLIPSPPVLTNCSQEWLSSWYMSSFQCRSSIHIGRGPGLSCWSIFNSYRFLNQTPTRLTLDSLMIHSVLCTLRTSCSISISWVDVR